MRVRTYKVEAPGRDVEYLTVTAKKAQKLVRELHRAGVQATMRRVTNRAELREACGT